MEQPTYVTSLRRFLGMVTYMSKFVPNVSVVSELLHALLKENVTLYWSAAQQMAFTKVKTLILQSPILRYFDPTKQLVIQTDASSSGLGSCLMQEGQPIAFASLALTDAERRYAQIENELLTIVFAAEKFSQYTYGRLTVVQSDYKPL